MCAYEGRDLCGIPYREVQEGTSNVNELCSLTLRDFASLARSKEELPRLEREKTVRDKGQLKKHKSINAPITKAL